MVQKTESGCSCSGNTMNNVSGCCGQTLSAGSETESMPWIIGEIETATRSIPRVNTKLTLEDEIGSWKARWGIRRMNYKIQPGLYGVGSPNADSPVVVSANYKMSFDRLRCELKGLDLWILVLDTRGINVWCAAGKGTFGTEEVVNRIAQVELSKIVNHRTLVLPQLGAPGVSAHKVLKQSGFKVVYGPVRATDVPAFLQAGLKATDEMREVRFDLSDRLVLTPVEVVSTIKPALILLAVLLVMNIILGKGGSASNIIAYTAFDFIPFLGAILTGTVIVPLLLPYIPGRAFAWKGWLMGLVWAGTYIWLLTSSATWSQVLFYCLTLPPIASYLAMNFTGSSTYTSFSGVAKEMKLAVPLQLVSVVGGIVLLAGRLLLGFN